MSSIPGGGGRGGGRNTEQQKIFIRQATILRKNLHDYDNKLRDPRGEDWPTMLGRLNAAMNQSATMDRNIEDVMEHFCYLPKQSTANAQDIPFFLSTRLESPPTDETAASKAAAEKDKMMTFANNNNNNNNNTNGDPTQLLAQYETRAAQLAAEYEENMVRF